MLTEMHSKGGIDMKMTKEYVIPKVELIALCADDVLTSSDGFEGEEHSLFQSPFFDEA